jgi:hypothetical protein
MLLIWDDGLPLSEAAKHLDIPISTAYDRYVKANELLVKHRLVRKKDIARVVRTQERNEMRAAVRLGVATAGPNWDTTFSHSAPLDRSIRRNGVFRAPEPRYSQHATGCRCIECSALRNDPYIRGKVPALNISAPIIYVDPANATVLPYSAEDMAHLRSPIRADESCTRRPAPDLIAPASDLSAALNEQTAYRHRHRERAIKSRTYGGKYAGRKPPKTTVPGFDLGTASGTYRAHTDLVSVEAIERALEQAEARADRKN